MYKFFSQHEDIIAGMSTRDDGNMKTHGEHSTEQAIENRKKFCEGNNINHEQVITACVEHTINVAVVDNQSESFINSTDALVTSKKDVYLAITSADCFPVLMYDNKNNVIGIAHAGWRGIVKGVVPETLKAMVTEGAELDKIKLTVGPGISQDKCDFKFKDKIAEFGLYNQDKYIVEGSTIDKVKVDLRQIILDQSERFGINQDNMHDCGACTFAEEGHFFSARRDGKEFSAMISIIGM